MFVEIGNAFHGSPYYWQVWCISSSVSRILTGRGSLARVCCNCCCTFCVVVAVVHLGFEVSMSVPRVRGPSSSSSFYSSSSSSGVDRLDRWMVGWLVWDVSRVRLLTVFLILPRTRGLKGKRVVSQTPFGSGSRTLSSTAGLPLCPVVVGLRTLSSSSVPQ